MGKNSQNTLGRALFRSRFNKSTAPPTAERWLHTSELNDGIDWSKMKSVTEETSLDDFLNTAELAGTEFESERLNVKFVQPLTNKGVLTKEQQTKITEIQQQNIDLLRIPRRPAWKGNDYDAETLQLKERESFLEWRRNLAKAQENDHLSMTPFEKNLEFWRQLWRVIERSDVIVQIVDARNPLLFRCEDLEKYVKEVDNNKLNLLLVNKSDFLTDRQRLAWLRYFENLNVRVVFWSAVLANKELDNIDGLSDYLSDINRTRTDSEMTSGSNITEEADEDENESEDESEEETASPIANKFKFLSDEKDDDKTDTESEKQDETKTDDEETDKGSESEEDEENEDEKEIEEKVEPVKKDDPKPKVEEKADSQKETIEDLTEKLKKLNMTEEEYKKSKVLGPTELIELFKEVSKQIPGKTGCVTIGLVGYPNVGKSSTLNALLRNKKVAVSETPGRTKHFQTFFLEEELMLCDCPGLVFPSFVSTKGELIINGILPIDQMKDYVEPMNLLIHHIPKSVFEMIYGILIKKPEEDPDPNRLCTAEEVCSCYAFYRGFRNHKGTADVQRAARYILKDYVNGKLLYCYPPTNQDPVAFQDHRYEVSKEIKYLEKIKKIQDRMLETKKNPNLSSFDREFFASQEPRALTKGSVVGQHRKNKVNYNASGIENGVKQHKKHFNAHKKEKLRRKTSHFDQASY